MEAKIAVSFRSTFRDYIYIILKLLIKQFEKFNKKISRSLLTLSYETGSKDRGFFSFFFSCFSERLKIF